MVGNADDDILIAGSTDFDARDARAGPHHAGVDPHRRARYASQPSGDGWRPERGKSADRCRGARDRAKDVLTGSSGDDWFLFNSDGDGVVTDKATDLSTFESQYAEETSTG